MITTPAEIEVEEAGLRVRAAKKAIVESIGTQEEVYALIKDFEDKVDIVDSLMKRYRMSAVSKRCIAKYRHMLAIKAFLKDKGFAPYEFRIK